MRDFDKPTEQKSSAIDFEAARRDANTAFQKNLEPPRKLTPEAERAIAEAQERRAKHPHDVSMPPEHFGRQGLEPVRYGDWEINGIICDF